MFDPYDVLSIQLGNVWSLACCQSYVMFDPYDVVSNQIFFKLAGLKQLWKVFPKGSSPKNHPKIVEKLFKISTKKSPETMSENLSENHQKIDKKNIRTVVQKIIKKKGPQIIKLFCQ